MILTTTLWDYIVDKQEVLDYAIAQKKRFDPTRRHREFALLGEVAEFVNEFREDFKWWSHKLNERSRIADEYIDILHFYAGLAIQEDKEAVFYRKHAYVYVMNETRYKRLDMFESLYQLRIEKNIHECVARATVIMERLGFTTDELRKAYDIKNAENFARIENGY